MRTRRGSSERVPLRPPEPERVPWRPPEPRMLINHVRSSDGIENLFSKSLWRVLERLSLEIWEIESWETQNILNIGNFDMLINWFSKILELFFCPICKMKQFWYFYVSLWSGKKMSFLFGLCQNGVLAPFCKDWEPIFPPNTSKRLRFPWIPLIYPQTPPDITQTPPRHIQGTGHANRHKQTPNDTARHTQTAPVSVLGRLDVFEGYLGSQSLQYGAKTPFWHSPTRNYFCSPDYTETSKYQNRRISALQKWLSLAFIFIFWVCQRKIVCYSCFWSHCTILQASYFNKLPLSWFLIIWDFYNSSL